MRARTVAALLVAVTLVVTGYMALRAVDLIRTGQLDGILLGVGVLLLVAVAALLTSLGSQGPDWSPLAQSPLQLL